MQDLYFIMATRPAKKIHLLKQNLNAVEGNQ